MRILWLFALGFSFVLSVFAAFRGGYIGPDYYTHFARLTSGVRFLTSRPRAHRRTAR